MKFNDHFLSWTLIFTITVWIIFVLLKLFNIQGVYSILFAGLILTLISGLMYSILYKEKYHLDKWFILWTLTHSLQFWLITLILNYLTISSELLYFLVFSLILNILTWIIKHLIFYKMKMTIGKFVVVSIVLIILIIVLPFNIYSSNEANTSTFSNQINDFINNIKNSFSENTANLQSINKIPQDTQLNSNSLTNPEQELITKCQNSFNTCKDISEQKWGLALSIIKIQAFSEESINNAEEFFKTWKGFGISQYSLPVALEIPQGKQIKDMFPLVLIAIKLEKEGGQLPLVLICNKEGNLNPLSRAELAC